MKAFVVMGRVLKAAYDELFLCVFLSMIWWACPLILLLLIGAIAQYAGGILETIPTATGIGGLVLVALIILAIQPRMAMGVQHVANRIANYKRADSGFFWDGTRQYQRQGYILFLVSLLIPAAIAFNIWFYLNSQGWVQFIGVIWLWLFLFSLMAGQYFFPLFWQQDEPNIRLALRNSILLALQNPLYSFLMLIFQLVLLAISIALTLPLIVLAPALLAFANNFALVGLLQEMGMAPQPPETPAR